MLEQRREIVEKHIKTHSAHSVEDCDAPVFDTLKKIKLLHPLIYKRCSSLSPSFNI